MQFSAMQALLNSLEITISDKWLSLVKAGSHILIILNIGVVVVVGEPQAHKIIQSLYRSQHS